MVLKCVFKGIVSGGMNVKLKFLWYQKNIWYQIAYAEHWIKQKYSPKLSFSSVRASSKCRDDEF